MQTITIPQTVPAFSRRVYEKLLDVPEGKVTTYGDLAQALGTSAYRAVGQALRRNPCAPDVPCHRVVASDGTIGGFNGHTTGTQITRKQRLLSREGVRVRDGKVDLDTHRHRFA
jgi:methylated-DNA-[protein]-cysteine S-methyltransferase